jgi:hypothetical protein
MPPPKIKEARYLIRLANERSHTPLEQTQLLKQVRELLPTQKAKAINLRVSPAAIEFDLFIPFDANAHDYVSSLQGLGAMLTCKRLDLPTMPVDPVVAITEARHLFNEQRFWEVHEVLEGLWKELRGSEKELVQGLIIAAAALVHVQKNEPDPVWKMLEDAMRRLKNKPDHYLGWDVKKFRDHFTRVLDTKKIEIPTV